MAFVAGKNTKWLVEDPTVERDLSAFLDNVSGAMGRALSEVSAFGDSGVKNIPSLQNSTFSVSGHYDPTATTGPNAVASALLTATATAGMKFGPDGSTTGKPRVTAEVWLTNYTITSAVADKVSFEAEFQVDGTVTFDTFT